MAKYVYICSAGHSGSTLLDLILGSHSKIASLGEIDQLSKNLALDTPCACGQTVRSCPVWRKVTTIVSKELDIDIAQNPYSLHMGYPKASTVIDYAHQTTMYLLRRRVLLGLYYLRTRFGPIVPRLFIRPIERAISNNVEVFDAVRSVLSVDTVVDSSKSYLKAIALYLLDPQNVRILLLSRDGRGVFWSRIKRGVPRERALREWKNQYTRGIPLLERHVNSKHLLRVTYEALSSNPKTEITRICDFIQLPFESCMLDFRSKVHHITNGNDMRLSSSEEVTPDNEWKNCLSAIDLAYFERHGATLNRLLGYE